MLLKIAEYIFVTISLLLVLALIANKIYIVNLKDNIKKSDFVAGIVFLFVGYILFALFVGMLMPAVYKKFIMILFAGFPFIIGRLATYEKEKFYMLIQIVCIAISSVFVVLFG